MKLSFEYGTQLIQFNVEYRKRKSLGIEIEPPDIVNVIAPENASESDIISAVKAKAKWISQKLFEIKEMEYKKREKEYVNGESFMYLGRNYPLQILMHYNVRKPETRLYRGKFHITANTKDWDKLKESLEDWYREKTLEKVTERVEYFQSYFTEKPVAIKVKDQKKRWGSCTPNGELYFNWRCSMAPAYIIDYIVVHEMCHMIYLNHSAEFWNLVGRVLPDYERRREWLKNHGVRLDL